MNMCIFMKPFRLLAVCSASLLLAACLESGSSSDSSGGGTVTGTGGSTARMTISGDYLYAIAGSRVQLFDIATPASPLPYVSVEVQWDIQTLFPYDDYLLVGAASGLHILDNTDPASPQYVGDFQHARAIDPVVAQDDVAYVTLKRDSSLPGTDIANQLNVIDIQDVTSPQLLQTLPMQGPSGLAVQGDTLYVCDGVAGLKRFDLSDPIQPDYRDAIAGLDCRDVIAQGDLLYVIDEFGLSQFDISGEIPRLLSSIDTEPVVYVVSE